MHSEYARANVIIFLLLLIAAIAWLCALQRHFMLKKLIRTISEFIVEFIGEILVQGCLALVGVAVIGVIALLFGVDLPAVSDNPELYVGVGILTIIVIVVVVVFLTRKSRGAVRDEERF